MNVGDILRKKTSRIATVRMNETVAIAAQLMRASNISALVVKDVVRTEGNTAVGMICTVVPSTPASSKPPILPPVAVRKLRVTTAGSGLFRPGYRSETESPVGF